MDCKENQSPECLDAIIETIKKNEASRRLQSVISVIGIVAIVVILVCFILNIVNFAKNYDTEEVGEEISTRATAMIQDPNTQEMLKKAIVDFQEKFIPAAKTAFSAKYENAGPHFKALFEKELSDLNNYLNGEFKSEVEANFESLFQQFKTDCKAKLEAKGITAEQSEVLYKEFVQSFIVDVAEVLEKHLEASMESLEALHSDICALSESEEYKSLEGMDHEDIASTLIENLLIRCVYEVNPERGEQNYNNGEI